LSNRHAIVTGSTSGIGFAIARGLAEAGAAVVISGRTQNNVDAARKRLVAEVARAKIEGIAADLAKPDCVAAFIERVPQTDILVNIRTVITISVR
jgi:NAD(P)-dependent dehydrogenase (short-subunit alcohol dehydrogenase family)